MQYANNYRIATVISYSSYHNPFIERVIAEAKKVSNEVVVISYDCFFDGEEDKDLLTHLVTSKLKLGSSKAPSRFFHNNARKVGFEALQGNYDFVLFIDSDEVLEGDRVKDWLDYKVEQGQDYKLAHFWYYRDTCYRANEVEEGAVLVSKTTLQDHNMNWFGDREREDFSKRWNYMASYNNQVLGHHYSWAGTKEMLDRKVAAWGHNADNYNWEAMLNQEFSHEFNYVCPFRFYTFTKINPYVGFTFEK